MNEAQLKDLHNFIVRAKQATYVGSGRKLLPYRLGSFDLQFADGDWTYHDSYLGESDFIGQEIVYYRGKVVWGMNYFGYILRPDRITSAQAGQVIKQSLSQMYLEGRFLGGYQYTVDNFTYIDAGEGSIQLFRGKESIAIQGDIVYELVYHGGVVKD